MKKTIERSFKRNKSIVILVCILLNMTILMPTLAIADEPTTTTLCYSFSFNEPSLQPTQLLDRSFTRINIPGCIAIGYGVGLPNVPVKFVKLLIPPGTSVANVDVSATPVQIIPEDIDLIKNPVIPYQASIPFGDPMPDEIAFDEETYGSSDAFPSTIIRNQGVGWCRGYAILSLALTPIQYIPLDGTLIYYPEMTVTIELKQNDNAINRYYRNDANDEEWVKHLIWNPEMISSYYTPILPTFVYPGGLCDPSENYDYVIITTTYNGLNDWATSPSLPYNWTSLMNKHQIQDGLSCTLVTIQEINAEQAYWNTSNPLFNDTQAHIREFCRDAYTDWGTDYILIGGDGEWIPARHMDYNYEPNVDADIYWSHLDNTFNDDNDNDWGEAGDSGFDLYAELYLGRLTCDTPQDVSNWMNKSFYYADSNDEDYLDNAGFYGGNTGWNCEGDDFMEYSAIKGTNDWLGPDPHADGPYPTWAGFQYGFETWNATQPGKEFNLSVKWTAEPPNPGWQGGSTSSAVTGFKNAINNNQVTLISGIAHADAYMSLDVEYYEWESQYHNTRPFFIHDYGCHCGDYDAADDGVLHSMLFHSDTELAFGCVYNTGYGWGNYDTTNSSSAFQAKAFWDYFFDTTNNSMSVANWQLGKAMEWARDTMAPTIGWDSFYGTWRGIIESCSLFADPAQKLKPPVNTAGDILISQLSEQWNFIGLPFRLSALQSSINKNDIIVRYNAMEYTWADAVSAGIISDYLFGWNASNQNYVFSNILEPGEGYWMYAYENCGLWVRNITVVSGDKITDVDSGWNVMSVPESIPVNKTDVIVTFNGTDYTWADAVTMGIINDYVFGWNRQAQSYIFTDIFEPGYCYWMYVYQPCTLKENVT